MARIYCFIAFVLLAFCPSSQFIGSAFAQEVYDILAFDETATGPWSDIDNTTITVPKVPFKSIEMDGTPSMDEYGGFAGVSVTPGENAWLLPFPTDRGWDGPDDSSFTFWMAHDDAYLYLGVDVKDDVVNSDDPSASFFQDDAIEIVTDVWNDNYDNNTDLSNDAYGGHAYINFEGKFSWWDEEAEQVISPNGQRWSSAVDWKYGEEEDIFGFGEATETGWNMEVRFKKELFEDPVAGIKLEEGTRMGFNIGLDDDDNTSLGDTGDLDLQYFWANRERFLGWNEDEDDGFFTQAEVATAFEELGGGSLTGSTALTGAWGLNQAGRLSHGGTGEILFGGFLEVEEPDPPVVDPPVVDPPVVDPPVVDPPVVDPPVVDPPVVDPPVVDPPVVDPPVVDPPTTPVDPVACDPSTRGDIDGNGKPEFADFLIISTNFGMNVENHIAGDVDCDGVVAFGDFLAFSTSFGIATGVWDGDPLPEDPVAIDPIDPGPAVDPVDPVIVVDPEPIICDPSSAGDVDGNGELEFADFLIISNSFGQEVANHTEGDVDCDGVVAFSDFLEFSISFGLATGVWDGDPIAAASVPEPNGSLIALLGIVGMLLTRKRAKRNISN